MHDDAAAIGARGIAHQLFQDVQDNLKAQVAVDMGVDLIAGVPVKRRSPGKLFRPQYPLAVMAVGVAIFHLHELRDDGSVGEQLDLFFKELQLATPRRRQGDRLLSFGKRPFEATLVNDAASVSDEEAIERCIFSTQNLLVELEYLRSNQGTWLVECGNAVLVE